MNRSRIIAVTGAVLAAVLLLTGCGTSSSSTSSAPKAKKTVVVFAAASLKEAFTSLGTSFEAKHPGVTVKFNFAGSDTLAASIDAGAPVDVFAAASTKTLGTVTDAKHGIGSPTTFARNQLEIAVPRGNPRHIASLADTTKSGTKLVLCAATVPCGAAAAKAYAAAKLTPKPASFELDVKSVLNKVQLGEADAGLVYVTDVKAAAGKVDGAPFPESAKAIATYPIVGVDTGKDAAEGKAFIDYVLSKTGQDVLAADGFLMP
ncbi:MAG: molybdate ABC transporter substrate-binding protein [Pseudonocardiales bacterium]|nr:MAG: molybdate ABC transporter substrate-binding protein [Pseudonocardiales bacterium]